MRVYLRRKLCLCLFFFIAHSSWFPDFYSGRAQTTCEIHLAERNYEEGIAATMPNLANGERAIVTTGPSTNIFCMCEQIERYSIEVMRCRILCNNEEMFRVVNNRVDPPDPEDAHPFFRSTVLSDVIGSGPRYVYNDRDPPLPGPPIWALITVLDAPHFPPYVFFFEDGESSDSDLYDTTSERNEITSESPPIQRTQSYPNSLKDRERTSASEGRKRSGSSISKFHYVEDYVTLQVCTGGTPGVACPIMHNEFDVGQIVYILKIEIDKVKEGKSVGCISAEGLMKMNRRAAEYKQSGFRDPLRRTGDKLLTIDDYQAYIISDTPERTSWIVQSNSADSSSTPGSSASHAQQASIVDSFNALQIQGGKTPEKSPKPESNVSTTFTSNYKLNFNMFVFIILFIILFTFIIHKHDRSIEDTKLSLI